MSSGPEVQRSWPYGPFHAGDQLDPKREVVGLEVTTDGTGCRDQLRLSDRQLIPLENVQPGTSSVLETPKGLPVSDDLAIAIEQAVSRAGHGLVEPLVEVARSNGYRVFVVGGAIRDVLVGRDETVTDIDIFGDLGTVTAAQMTGWVRLQSQPEPQDCPDWWYPSTEVSAIGVVHVRALIPGGLANSAKEERFLQYMPFLQSVEPDGRPVFCGTLETDAKWRDVRFNTLYYDLADHVLFDPLDGLEDLKLTASCLQQWPSRKGVLASVTPLTIPAARHRNYDYLARIFARVLKALALIDPQQQQQQEQQEAIEPWFKDWATLWRAAAYEGDEVTPAAAKSLTFFLGLYRVCVCQGPASPCRCTLDFVANCCRVEAARECVTAALSSGQRGADHKPPHLLGSGLVFRAGETFLPLNDDPAPPGTRAAQLLGAMLAGADYEPTDGMRAWRWDGNLLYEVDGSGRFIPV